jgi:hypothetical protein
MLRAFKIFAMLVAGIVLGLAATWVTAIRGTMGGSVTDGPWHTSLYTGSSEGGPYLRAAIAVHGAALDGNCIYHLEGRDLPTRWWSITAYGADDFLIPNDAGRYSVSMNSVARDADGRFKVTLSKAKAEGNWIPVAPGRFDLTFRLYNPQADVIADPAHVALPAIKKAGCE